MLRHPTLKKMLEIFSYSKIQHAIEDNILFQMIFQSYVSQHATPPGPEVSS